VIPELHGFTVCHGLAVFVGCPLVVSELFQAVQGRFGDVDTELFHCVDTFSHRVGASTYGFDVIAVLSNLGDGFWFGAVGVNGIEVFSYAAFFQ